MDTLTNFWRSFKRQPMGLAGLGMLLLVILMAIFAPLLAPYDPEAAVKVTLDTIYAPPSPAHWLGTDDAGKDVLTNLIYGATVSLLVGFFAEICLSGASHWRGQYVHGSPPHLPYGLPADGG